MTILFFPATLGVVKYMAVALTATNRQEQQNDFPFLKVQCTGALVLQ
jgi:hypothetical protein